MGGVRASITAVASRKNMFSVLSLDDEGGSSNTSSSSAKQSKITNTLNNGIKHQNVVKNTHEIAVDVVSAEPRKLHLRSPLVWIDLEMTGLDAEKHRILEIACIITDGKLNKLIEGPHLIINQSEQTILGMNEWCQEHHVVSGLVECVQKSSITEHEAEMQVLEFVREHTAGEAQLAGNSIYNDLMFLRKYMPELAAHFSHVLVDVSSIKSLSRRWYPKDAEKAPIKKNKHRALDDIKESIAELKYLRSAIFRDPQSNSRSSSGKQLKRTNVLNNGVDATSIKHQTLVMNGAITHEEDVDGSSNEPRKLDDHLPLVWIDLEMTGLGVEKHRILEIACIITDGNLNKSIEGPDLVINQSEETILGMSEWCQEHHVLSGLVESVQKSTITEREAEMQVLEFVREHTASEAQLAGNSIYNDLMFLRKYMPELAAHFSHVLVDVSSIKSLCRRWYPKEKAPIKENKHRALDDINESIAELKYLRSAIFKAPWKWRSNNS